MVIEIFSLLFGVTSYQHLYCLFIVFKLIHALRIMCLPVVEIL